MKRLLFTLLLTLALAEVLPAQVSTNRSLSVNVGHSVVLTWNASTTSGVTYRVYYSVVSGGPYMMLATGLTTLGYTDVSAISGNTYFYVVTAVDVNGNESVFSNQATAVVPKP